MLMRTSRYEEAEAMIREALAGNMEEPELFLLLARVLNEQRKFKAAHEAVKEAIGLMPDEPEAFYMRAVICRDQGKSKEGLVAIDQAIAIDSEDEDYFALKAGLLLDRSKWKESLEAAENGLALDADNESCLFYRGVALAKLGRGDEAGENSLKLLSLDADDAANHVSRGWVLVESGKGEEASRHFSEALRIDSDREDAKTGLTHAVILSRPILGRLMKVLLSIDRLSIWVVIIGVVVALRLGRYLENTEGLEVFGSILQALMWGSFFVLMSSQVFFEWGLKGNPHTRYALSERHIRGLKWATPLLVLGWLGFCVWVWEGTRSTPVLSYMTLALAIMLRECFESANHWVRKRMWWLMGGLGAAALAVFWMQFFVIAPEAMKFVELLKLEAAGGEVDKKSEGVDLEGLKDLLRLRIWTVVYPALAIALIGLFRDTISEWLETKAPDEGWE